MNKPALLWSPDPHDYVWSPDGPECHVCGFVHTTDNQDEELFEALMAQLEEQITEILTDKQPR